MTRTHIPAGAVAALALGLAVAVPASAATVRTLALDAAAIAAIEVALDDERHAAATYAGVIGAFGPVRPFVNILRAEHTHEARLVDLLVRAGVAVPPDPYKTGGKTVKAPQTLAAACQTGVKAEIANAALYDEDLLPKVTGNAEVTAAFVALRDASTRNHLPAFQRCAGGRLGAAPASPGGGLGLIPAALQAALAPTFW
jgi:hypothetical protein